MKIPQDMIAGTIHKTKAFGDLKIIKYENSNTVHVEFISTGYITFTRSSHIRSGRVKDLFSPVIYGVGFIGGVEFKSSTNDELNKNYQHWHSMMNRCYNKVFQKENPAYKDCSVDPCWHNFQSFAKWHEDSHPNDGGSYQLDKDLLVVGNKEYSPDACVFIPQWLNVFTLDSKATRGEFPIGVSYFKRDGLFRASCRDGKQRNLGHFSTPNEAHLAWRNYKLEMAVRYKSAMDLIDKRIYPNVIKIIREAR